MFSFVSLHKQIKSVLGLLTNASWLLSAEFIAKLSRIVTVVVLAAQLGPVAYGTAMLALAFHDVFGLLLRAGVGSQIINCRKEDLTRYAKNGLIIQWAICIIIALSQFFTADLLASLYDKPDVALLLKLMVVIYLFYPWVSIKIFLVQRENKMRWFSIRNGICIIVENLSIAMSALLGADILSIAIGKLAFSSLWLVLFAVAPVKSYGVQIDFSTIRHMLNVSGKLFNTEFLKAIRMNADTFIAGKILTPELFGIYTFAKNAGVGLSQSISNVFISALFPYLCKLQRSCALLEQQSKLILISSAFSLMFVIQACMVPIYVPIIFDSKWSSAIPIISVLCLAAVPNFIIDILCCLQRVKEHYHNESLIRLFCLVVSLLGLFLVTIKQPIQFAVIMLISSTICLVGTYCMHYLTREKLNDFVFIK